MKRLLLMISASFVFSAFAGKTVVGVVNWDCSLPSDTYFGHYATESLSPARFRHATPFYADVKGPDRIDYHWRTVEEYEREMQYAIDAGIDYFAYCWYGELKEKDFSPVAKRESCCDRHVWELATARQLHEKSALRDKLKLCAILVVVHPIAELEYESLARAMGQPWYQRAKGRPLLYLFGGKGDDVLTHVRTACRRVGTDDPFVVVLGCRSYDAAGDEGVQAISAYNDGAVGIDDFNAQNEKTIFANARRVSTGMSVIPSFTVGWNPSPRIMHPVPWCEYPATNYMSMASEKDLLKGARKMVDWIRSNRAACPTGHILTFAWNEFEEGGWICPTWRAAGGPDTSRLEAFRKVADLWRRELSGDALQSKPTIREEIQ